MAVVAAVMAGAQAVVRTTGPRHASRWQLTLWLSTKPGHRIFFAQAIFDSIRQSYTFGSQKGLTKTNRGTPTSIRGPSTAVAMDTQSPARVPSKTVNTRSAIIANEPTSTQ